MATEFLIEKNIPIPDKRAWKYPWKEMEVGDSIFIKGKSINALTATGLRYLKKDGWDFAMRTVDGGVRVWRTK